MISLTFGCISFSIISIDLEFSLLLFVECLILSKEILGNNHPNTLTSMNNLALLYEKQGEYEKAQNLRNNLV